MDFRSVVHELAGSGLEIGLGVEVVVVVGLSEMFVLV